MNPFPLVRKPPPRRALFWWAGAGTSVVAWYWVMGLAVVAYLSPLPERGWSPVEAIGWPIAMVAVTASSFTTAETYARLARGLPLRGHRVFRLAMFAAVGVIQLAQLALTVEFLLSGELSAAASVGNGLVYGFQIVAVVAGLRAVRGIRSAV